MVMPPASASSSWPSTALWHRQVLRRRVRHGRVALGTAAVTAAVLLAYPVWFALAGPAHLSGPIWGPNSASATAAPTSGLRLPVCTIALVLALAHRFGGYQAPTLFAVSTSGSACLAVLVVGVVVWRRDRRLWLFGVIGVLSVPLSFGLQDRHWTLWRLFVRFPLMDNVIPSRFLLITYLAAAVMLGLDRRPHPRTVGRRVRRPRARPGATSVPAGPGPERWPRRWSPRSRSCRSRSTTARDCPFTVQPVVVPTWFRTVAPHLALQTGRPGVSGAVPSYPERDDLAGRRAG